MRKYGGKRHSHNFPDHHPPKGYINWWEAELDSDNKKSERQQSRILVEKEIADYHDNQKKVKKRYPRLLTSL